MFTDVLDFEVHWNCRLSVHGLEDSGIAGDIISIGTVDFLRMASKAVASPVI